MCVGKYKDIYEYLIDKINQNQDINISTIYSCFDIEKDSVWDKVINYKFPADDVFNDYLQDCVLRLRISKLRIKQQSLKASLTSVNDFEQKYQILAEMKNIDEQIAQLEKDVK